MAYSRNDLFKIGTSPLSHTHTSPALESALISLPEIKRETKHGSLQAYQALEYSVHGSVDSSAPNGSISRSSSSKPRSRARGNRSSPKFSQEIIHLNVVDTRVESSSLPPILEPHVGAYVPPARRQILPQSQSQTQQPNQQREQTLARGRSSSISRQLRSLAGRGWARSNQTPAHSITHGLPTAILAGW